MQRNTEFFFNKILGFEKLVYSRWGNYVIIRDKSFVKHDRLHSASIFTLPEVEETQPTVPMLFSIILRLPSSFSSPFNMNLVAHLRSAASRG